MIGSAQIPPPSDADPRLGRVVSERYRLLQRLASGGMGVVYRAERVALGRTVAVKFLLDPLASESRYLKHFEREAEAMGRLSHPHCVPIVDFGVDQSPYLVMDFVAGMTLKDVISGRALSWQRAVRITRQLLAGLAHAHGQRIVHRDIKPANIMLTETTGLGDHVRILDFGLAALREGAGGAAETSSISTVVGTPQYMSPEQWRAEPVDERTDVYATGVVLYEMLVGQRPFPDEDPLDLMHAHLGQKPPKLPGSVPRALQGIVKRALAKEPNDRFQSAQEFSEALQVLPGSGMEAPIIAPRPAQMPVAQQPATPPRAAAKSKPRRRRAFGATMLRTSVAVSVAAAAFAWGPTLAQRSLDAMDPALPPADILAVRGEQPELVTTAAPAALGAAPSAPSALDRGAMAEAQGAPTAPEPFDDPASFVAEEEAEGTSTIEASDDTPRAQLPADAPLMDVLGTEQPTSPGADNAGASTEEAPELPGPSAPESATAVAEQDATAEEETADEATADEAVAAPEVPTPTDDETSNKLAAIRRMLDTGQNQPALKALQNLRGEQPNNAHLAYLIGTIYYERRWLSDAFQRYGEAMQLDPRYRTRRDLIGQMADALNSDSTYPVIARVLVRGAGRHALPALRRATKHGKTQKARARAQILIRRIQRSR